VQSARRGAKLNYLKRLTGKCPEGEQLVYFKAGGRVCSKCMSKKKACGGTKISKGSEGFPKGIQSNSDTKMRNPRAKYITNSPYLNPQPYYTED